VENHVDVYHLWYLHRSSLGALDHTRFTHRQTGGNWASYEPLRDPDPTAAALGEGMLPIAHLDLRDRRGVGAHLIFPNHMMATSAAFFATYVAVPTAPDHTVLQLRIRAEPGTDPGAALAAVRAFIDEDVRACEQVQMGMGSPRFSVGPLARDHELPVTRFQRSVLGAMGTDVALATGSADDRPPAPHPSDRAT
jgi:phenylpropionate dioxygenase-like ring-hydroxylating dioxygenase large terminal subunit